LLRVEFYRSRDRTALRRHPRGAAVTVYKHDPDALRGSAGQFAGTGPACGWHMDPLSPCERSRALREVSAQLARAAQENVKATQQRLDRARNLLQVIWLLREVRRRGRDRGGG
jgi:hypothetical protein